MTLGVNHRTMSDCSACGRAQRALESILRCGGALRLGGAMWVERPAFSPPEISANQHYGINCLSTRQPLLRVMPTPVNVTGKAFRST